VDSLDVDDGREDDERLELDTAKFHSKGGDTSMLHDPSLNRARLLKVRMVNSPDATARLWSGLSGSQPQLPLQNPVWRKCTWRQSDGGFQRRTRAVPGGKNPLLGAVVLASAFCMVQPAV
jgi:CelD/BcsL family acetyltransferase involved in cellulose biosynthesis